MKYLPQLDGLRAIAILMVFAQHAFPLPLLWAGVDLFFILSGYLITSILLRDRESLSFAGMARKFYLRRAERILPAYALFLLVILCVWRPDLRHMWVYCVTFTQNIPFAMRTMPIGPLYPLWSLAVENHFYLVWPAVVFLLPRRWLTPVLIGIIVVEPILRAICSHLFATPDAIYSLTPFRLDALAFGALAALWLPHCHPMRTIRWAQAATLVGIAVYAALSMHPFFRRGANSVSFNSLAYTLNIVVLGGMFVWTVLSRGKLTWLLSFRPLRGFGKISYTFYLIHLLLLMEFWKSFGRISSAAFAFLATTLIASLSWFLLERPVLALTAARRAAAPITPLADS